MLSPSGRGGPRRSKPTFDGAEQAMTKGAVFFVIGLAAATAAFAVGNGINEYQIARSARTYVIVNGVERDLTPAELISSFLIGDTIRAIPFGAVAAGLLFVPLFFVARTFQSLPPAAAYAFGCATGGLAGGVLSFVVWMIFGGWGPPFLLPAIAAGAVLAPTLIGACRWRNMRGVRARIDPVVNRGARPL
jgi:hypothetical protein